MVEHAVVDYGRTIERRQTARAIGEFALADVEGIAGSPLSENLLKRHDVRIVRRRPADQEVTSLMTGKAIAVLAADENIACAATDEVILADAAQENTWAPARKQRVVVRAPVENRRGIDLRRNVDR